MKAALSALALCVAAATAPAQSRQAFAQQVARGVADLSTSRVKQLGSGEWLREQLQIGAIAQSIEPADTPGARPVAVFKATISVYRSPKVSESRVRSDLPMEATSRRYEVEMRFEPDAAYGLWVFDRGRYWILDGAGKRQLELKMFPDLLRDAPLDAPHELAWAIMSP